MVSKELEARVRDALIQQKADDFCECAMKSDNYKNTVKGFITDLESGLGDVLSLLPNKEGKSTVEVRQDLLSQANFQYNTPNGLRSYIVEEEENVYNYLTKIKPEVESIKNMLNIFEAMGVSEKKVRKARNALEDFIEELSRYIKHNDKIVKRLAEIADSEGFDKAMQKEVRYEVIKEIFPTALDYKLHESKFYNLQSKINEIIKNVLASEEAGGNEIHNKEGEHATRYIKRFVNFQQTIIRVYAEHMVKEIYPEFSNS